MTSSLGFWGDSGPAPGIRVAVVPVPGTRGDELAAAEPATPGLSSPATTSAEKVV